LLRLEGASAGSLPSGHYLQPDDERPVTVSVSVVGVIEPVEHVCSRSYIHVSPELGSFLVSAVIGCSAGAILSHNHLR